MIPVTKTFLPSREEYQKYLAQIWDSGWVTNNGDLATSLEDKLEEYFGVSHVQYVSSGTMALQIAMHVLSVKDEVITTPFSYVATTNAVLWENYKPVFVDIEPESLTIDAQKIEEAITPQTSAILATHVYGISCAIEKIQAIADEHNLKVIYDAAHAFGVSYQGKSLASYGDLSVLSFHATKLFHTIEGGGLVTDDEKLAEDIFLCKTFGHEFEDFKQVGINGKNSELHAAMGHCLLPKIKGFIKTRKLLSECYHKHLNTRHIRFPAIADEVEYNYSYFPAIFESESAVERIVEKLGERDIQPRRYFYPSLHELPYIERKYTCPVSSDISKRVLCLPLYDSLKQSQVKYISNIINRVITS